MIFRAFTLFILFLGIGCAALQRPAEEYRVGYRQKGIASWYGEPFHGRPTASGEIFDMYAMTAAHRLLPLGTHVKVKNLDNGRTITLKVNDRGPFVRGRILDVSYEAARALSMIQSGTAPVELQVVKINPQETAPFTVQVGSFIMEETARELALNLRERYQNVSLSRSEIGTRTYYRVRVGMFSDERFAQQTARKLRKREGLETFVTRQER
jgi:rare lipoprotein A